MKKHIVKFRITAATLLLLATGVYGTPQEKPSRQQKLGKILKGYGEQGTPGVAVLVRKNGRVLFQRGYGVRELRTRATIDSRSNFRLASCTKQFTAMSVMLLVHDGKLRYDEPLTDVFSDFPKYGSTITIRNLLNHTSGLPDYEELMEVVAAGKPSIWSAQNQIQDKEVLALLEKQQSGKFAPGTQWSYSNSGYVVLGLVVARVSGEPFEKFLADRIFKPLGMDHTLAYVKGKNEIPERSYGHSLIGKIFEETDQSSTSATLGDGGVYSNLEDLSKWDDALTHHTLLSGAEMQPALEPLKLPDGSSPHWASGPGDADPLAGQPVSYGFGWFVDPFERHARMWHYGETMGFRTAIIRFMDDDLTVIVLGNCSNFDVSTMAFDVARIYLSDDN